MDGNFETDTCNILFRRRSVLCILLPFCTPTQFFLYSMLSLKGSVRFHVVLFDIQSAKPACKGK